MKKYGYVYLTTNLINGRIYVGQKRGTFKKFYFGGGTYIRRALKKYGENNFKVEIVAFATSKRMLNLLEIKYIAQYRKVFGKEWLYNILDGGEIGGGVSTHKKNCNCGWCIATSGRNKGIKIHTEEHKEELRKKMTGKKNPFYGEKHTQETCNLISKLYKGKRHSPATEFKKGVKQTPAQIRVRMEAIKRNNPNGAHCKPHTQKTKERIAKTKRRQCASGIVLRDKNGRFLRGVKYANSN